MLADALLLLALIQFAQFRMSFLPIHRIQVVKLTERITLERELLLGALRRAEIMTSDKANSVKLTFSQNSLVIHSNTPDVGEAREVIAITSLQMPG